MLILGIGTYSTGLEAIHSTGKLFMQRRLNAINILTMLSCSGLLYWEGMETFLPNSNLDCLRLSLQNKSANSEIFFSCDHNSCGSVAVFMAYASVKYLNMKELWKLQMEKWGHEMKSNQRRHQMFCCWYLKLKVKLNPCQVEPCPFYLLHSFRILSYYIFPPSLPHWKIFIFISTYPFAKTFPLYMASSWTYEQNGFP